MKIVLIMLIILLVLYLLLVAPKMIHRADRSSFLKNRFYAHRGLFDNESDAPENSLAAFKKAMDAGYGMEMDVQLSKDDIPVIFHDTWMDRVARDSNHDPVSGIGGNEKILRRGIGMESEKVPGADDDASAVHNEKLLLKNLSSV